MQGIEDAVRAAHAEDCAAQRVRRASLRRPSACPYTAHVAPGIVKTVFGDYLQVFRLSGASFESSDDEAAEHTGTSA